MKLLDLIRLGYTNISAFKKRNLMTVIVIGIPFGILFMLLFSFQGLENLLLYHASQATNGQVIIASRTCTIQEEITNNCTVDSMLSETIDLAADYGGQVKGIRYYYYSISEEPPNSTDLITPYLGEHHTIDNFYSLPSNIFNSLNIPKSDSQYTNTKALPVIIPFNEALTLSEIRLNKLQSDTKIIENTKKVQASTLGQTFAIGASSNTDLFISGIYPTWGENFSLAEKAGNFNILDLALSAITSDHDFNDTAYFTDTTNIWDYAPDLQLDESSSKVIVSFDDAEQAYAYYSYIYCNYEEAAQCDRGTAEELFGNQLNIMQAFSSFRRVFSHVAIALVIMGVIIMIFTFIRLIDQDNQNIALYRSLGASGHDIFIIYLSFLFELCIITSMFAVLLGLILCFILSIFNSSHLSAILTAHYLTAIEKPIILFGVNQFCFSLVAMILSIAPICSILSIDHFSNKNIAKKLKN